MLPFYRYSLACISVERLQGLSVPQENREPVTFRRDSFLAAFRSRIFSAVSIKLFLFALIVFTAPFVIFYPSALCALFSFCSFFPCTFIYGTAEPDGMKKTQKNG